MYNRRWRPHHAAMVQECSPATTQECDPPEVWQVCSIVVKTPSRHPDPGVACALDFRISDS